MYISPLTKAALFPEAPGDSDFPPGLIMDRIGGTSTCWMPFFAWMLALILAAAAAVRNVSLILKTGGNPNSLRTCGGSGLSWISLCALWERTIGTSWQWTSAASSLRLYCWW
jgi:hypothetical protein